MGKKLNFSDLYAMGIGFTIGSAVFSLTGVAAMYTGGSTFLAYIAAAVAILLMMFPVIIAGSVVPRQGVSYSLSQEAFNHSMGGFYFWIFLFGRVAMLANCTAFGIYFTSVFTTLNPLIVTGAIVLIFFVANLFGLKAAAQVQKIMNIVMFGAIILFIVMGAAKMNTVFVFNSENFARGAAGGFMSAVSLLVFSLGGGMAMLELGGVVEDAEKNLPKACVAVTMTVGVLFAGIGLATLGALPIVPMPKGAAVPGTLLFKGPSSSVINAAQAIFQNSTPLLYLFIFGGACLAIATTVNGSFGWYSAAVVKASKDGWFPKWFAKENKNGAPYRVYLIFVVATIIPLFFFGVDSIGTVNTNVIKTATNLQILANIIPNFGLLSLPKLYPEIWEKSKWHMSNGTLKIVCFVPSIVAIILWCLNFKELTTDIQITLAILFVVGALYAFIGGKTFAKEKKVQATPSNMNEKIS